MEDEIRQGSREASPPNSAKTPLKTGVNDSVSEQEDGEERISTQRTDDDRILFNNKHGEDRIPRNKRETQENDKDEDKILFKIKKTRNKRRTSQEPYVEVCTFDDTDKITLSKKCNYKVGITFLLNK